MNASREFIRDYFRRRAIAFPDFYTRRPLLPVESRIVNSIPKGGSVLDLCCGGGEIALAMAKRGAFVTGVDNVVEMKQLCAQLFSEEGCTGKFYLGDATKLLFADATFSHVVCAGNSLNCMTHEDARLTIAEAARVTVPGGSLYLTTLDPSSIPNLLAVLRGMFQSAPKWGFYYRSSYGLQSGVGMVPRGLSFLLPMGDAREYMRDAGLTYTVSRWRVGIKSSHLLFACHKVGRTA